VAHFSLINIILTTVLKCCGALSPKFALFLDFICFAWWSVSFGFLTHAMGPQVWKGCVGGTWGDESGDGPYICRLYKAGWVMTLSAVYVLSPLFLISCFIRHLLSVLLLFPFLFCSALSPSLPFYLKDTDDTNN